MSQPWNVQPHGPLSQLEPNLWEVEGDLPGLPLRRRMTVARSADGRLLVHSAIALDGPGMASLDALGPVSWIVVPNGYHRIDAPRYKARYPDAVVLCPRGSAAKAGERVAIDGAYDEVAPSDLRLSHLDGTAEREGVVEVRSPSGVTLIFNDCLFNQPHLPGFKGWLLKAMGSTGGPKVTFVARTFLTKDRKALRAHMERLADTPGLRRLVPGHGAVIDQDAAGVLRAVAAKL
ncbi:MAG: hypothetical protein AMXMBFR64_13090 [Myxococcales bacterium]